MHTNGAFRVLSAYDHRHRRVSVRKTVQRLSLPPAAPPAPPPLGEWTTTETHTYFYDDWNLVEERVARTDGTASTNRYVWGKDLSGSLQGAGGVGGLLAVIIDGSPYFPAYDNNGNVTRYFDSSGATVAAYAYDAFGRTLSATGPLADAFPHRFSTKYFDSETGLYYYGYRFYSPSLMRWLNRDPTGEIGGINLYVMCANCPLHSIDPLGTISISGFVKPSDGLGFLEGALLYYFGDGSTIHVPITKLGLSTEVKFYFDPCQFRKENYSGNDGTFDSFRMTRLSGWRKGGPGRIRWELKGDLRWEDNHKRCWTFSGNVKVFPDYFNFNPRPKKERGPVKESITRAVNRTGGGTSFWVIFDGTLEIKGKGSCQ